MLEECPHPETERTELVEEPYGTYYCLLCGETVYPSQHLHGL